MTKVQLRKRYLEARTKMDRAEAARLSTILANKFFENIDLSSIERLHTYVRIAKFNEIDSSIIYFRLWRDHPRIETFAPRIDVSGNIESVPFRQDSELVEHKWGIREPAFGTTIAASEIDLVIVPLVCFDERGHRVGYGKGMYDRLLAGCREDCVKVGLSYFGATEAITDAGNHDVTLDICLTPNDVYRWNTSDVSEAATSLVS